MTNKQKTLLLPSPSSSSFFFYLFFPVLLSYNNTVFKNEVPFSFLFIRSQELGASQQYFNYNNIVFTFSYFFGETLITLFITLQSATGVFLLIIIIYKHSVNNILYPVLYTIYEQLSKTVKPTAAAAAAGRPTTGGEKKKKNLFFLLNFISRSDK